MQKRDCHETACCCCRLTSSIILVINPVRQSKALLMRLRDCHEVACCCCRTASFYLSHLQHPREHIFTGEEDGPACLCGADRVEGLCKGGLLSDSMRGPVGSSPLHQSPPIDLQPVNLNPTESDAAIVQEQRTAPNNSCVSRISDMFRQPHSLRIRRNSVTAAHNSE